MPGIRAVTRTVQSTLAAIAVCLLLAVVVPALVLAATAAPAATPENTAEDLRELRAPSTRLALDGTTITLTSAQPYVPLGSGSIDYTVAIEPSETAQSMRIQFNVFNERGVLIHQRTRFINDIQDGIENAREALDAEAEDAAPASAPRITERFERELAEISASAGVCTVEVDVLLSSTEASSEGQLSDLLTVYDEQAAPSQLVTVMRVTSAPLRDPSGVFVVDPVSPEQVQLRRNLRDILRWLADTPSAHLSLAISPLLLEEWRDAADGYELPALDDADAAPVMVPADSEAAQSIADAVAELETAAESGRLTIVSLGFADPDLEQLSNDGRAIDIPAQYDRGNATLSGLAQQNYSAPIAATLSRESVAELTRAGIEVVVLPETAIEAAAGLLETLPARLRAVPSRTELVALVQGTRGPAAAPPVSSETPMQTAELLARGYQRLPAGSPAAASLDLGSYRDGVAPLLRTLTTLNGTPWIELGSHSDPAAAASASDAPQLTLNPLAKSQGTATASEHRETVAQGRLLASAYLALAPDSEGAQKAYDSSLIAQNGVGVGTSSPTAADALRLQHAADSASAAAAVFDAISIDVQSVTLPSAEGPIPITIQNATDEVLTVNLTLSPSSGLRFLGGDQSRVIDLPPQETFLNPTVRLHGVSSGDVTIRLSIDGYTIKEQTIRVTSSHIETVVTIAVVAIMGFALVAYIWRRTQRAAAEDVDQNLGG